MVVLEVPGDGLRPGVQALAGRALAQPHDQAGRFSTVMAVMTSLAFDIPQASDQPDHRGRRRAVSVLDVLRHPVLDVLNLDTTPSA